MADTPRGADSDLRSYRARIAAEEKKKAAKKKWDGRGKAPSKAAAVAWAIANGASEKEAKRLIRSGPSTGDDARAVVDIATDGVPGPAPVGGQSIPGSQEVADLPGRKAVTKPSGKGGKTTPDRTPTSPTPTAGGQVDVNNDGVVDDKDAEQAAYLASQGFTYRPPGGEALEASNTVLWPTDLSGLSPEEQQAISVQNRSPFADRATPQRGGGLMDGGSLGAVPRGPSQVGPRYFAADAVNMPTRWSQERKVEMQRLFQAVGLYGDKQPRTGEWGEAEDGMFKELLAYANRDGRKYWEQLAEWRQRPPAELIAKLKAAQPKKPTISVTLANPLDIRARAETVQQQLMGRVTPGFAEGVVDPYQQVDAAAQRATQAAVIADQEAGGGGTTQTTQAPTVDAFTEEQLRKEHPIEVDGYQFLGQFQSFMQMIGA